MKKINYYVIGGQYDAVNYGGTETIHAAKCLATKKEEHWDNWQGFHRPLIYKATDCVLASNFYGTNFYPKEMATPYMVWDSDGKRWELVK